MISLLAAELALSAWGPFAGTEVTDAPAQGAKKIRIIYLTQIPSMLYIVLDESFGSLSG